MKGTLFTGTFLLVMGGVTPAFGQDSLLYDTWLHSYQDPTRLDEFLQAHKAQYNDEYFRCSQEAQRLVSDEAKIRDRRCGVSAMSPAVTHVHFARLGFSRYSLFRNGAAAPLIGLGNDRNVWHGGYIQASFSFGSIAPIL